MFKVGDIVTGIHKSPYPITDDRFDYVVVEITHRNHMRIRPINSDIYNSNIFDVSQEFFIRKYIAREYSQKEGMKKMGYK